MNVGDYIKQHNHVAYCEAVIFPNGNIEDAEPSHLYKLIAISGKNCDEINSIMPADASPIHWMVCYTKCIAVWYQSILLPEDYTSEQIATVQELVNNKIIQSNIVGNTTNELERCNIKDKFLETGDDSLFSQLKETEIIKFSKVHSQKQEDL